MVSNSFFKGALWLNPDDISDLSYTITSRYAHTELGEKHEVWGIMYRNESLTRRGYMTSPSMERVGFWVYFKITPI